MFLTLNLILTKKQRFGESNFIGCNFIESVNARNKTNITHRTYYFYNDQIDLKDVDARLLKLDKKHYNEIDIYYIGYLTIKKIGDCNNINSENPLYLMINEMIGHFECNSIEFNSVEEKNENEYLVLDEIIENKEVLNKYKKVWEGIKKEIQTINSGKKIEYGKDF